MILSNVGILAAIRAGDLQIEGLTGHDPTQAPFNTTAVDLTLGPSISIPQAGPMAMDLRKQGIARFIHANAEHLTLTHAQPYSLGPNKLILCQTAQKVGFPMRPGRPCYCARVEGRSSIARCGILVHFTAPTIHAGFIGRITLEVINLGPNDFLLYPGMPICQLIVEATTTPEDAPNQFRGQQTPSGVV